MRFLRDRFADSTSEQSVATHLRRQRFRIFLRMLDEFSDPVQILDVGGRPDYWARMMTGLNIGRQIHVTLLNVTALQVNDPNIVAVRGDGRAMRQYADGQFDIVFSNSTIEHVGTADDQRQMADEVRRVGRAFYVQTPNKYFPIEPHFLFPLFQFLPVATRVKLVSTFALGWYERFTDEQLALMEVSSIQLLSRTEVERLFPDATIFEERYLGMVKSFVAHRGLVRPGVET